jgi:hypothetical protein
VRLQSLFTPVFAEERETEYASSGWPHFEASEDIYGEHGGWASLTQHSLDCGEFRVLSQFKMMVPYSRDYSKYKYQYR